MQLDLSSKRTLEDAIEVLLKMKASYTGSYFDAACCSIAALFEVPLSEIDERIKFLNRKS